MQVLMSQVRETSWHVSLLRFVIVTLYLHCAPCQCPLLVHDPRAVSRPRYCCRLPAHTSASAFVPAAREAGIANNASNTSNALEMYLSCPRSPSTQCYRYLPLAAPKGLSILHIFGPPIIAMQVCRRAQDHLAPR